MLAPGTDDVVVAFKSRYCQSCRQLLQRAFEPAAEAVSAAGGGPTFVVLDVDSNTIDHLLVKLDGQVRQAAHQPH